MKRIIFWILFILVSNILTGYIVESLTKNDLSRYNQQLINKFYLEFNTIVKDFYNISDIVFDSYILRDSELLAKLYSALILERGKDDTREYIYNKLLPVFNKINEKGYTQIHIIDKDGYSFLRLHLPDVYGDDIKSIRTVVSYAIDNHVKTTGLETGKHEIAYRVAYPIFYKGIFLGVVDLGLNTDFILNYINRELSGRFFLLVYKEAVKVMKEEVFKKLYEEASFAKGFYYNKKYSELNKDIYINDTTKSLQLLPPREYVLNSNNNVLIFLPLYDVNKVFLGYTVKIEKDSFYENILWRKYTLQVMIFILTVGFALGIMVISKRNEILKKEMEEKNRYLEKLNELNNMYNIVLEYSDQIVYDYNMKTGIVKRSGAIKDILGIEQLEFEKTHVNDFIRLLHPEDRDVALSIVQNPKPNNTKFDCRYKLRKKDGSYAYIHDQGVYMDIAGELHIFGTMKDISSTIKYQEAIQQAQRLESIGILAGGIAHDFNNLLAGIWNYIEMIRLMKDPNMIDDLIEKARNGFERAKALTNQLLTFSKGGEPNITVVNIKRLITDIVPFVLSGSAVRYKLTINDDVLYCLADEHQISQVFENILINARQSMSDKGEITVEVSKYIHKNGDSAITLLDGEYVKVSITDTGCGIPEEHLKRIFEPYFTTKKKGKGLGLAICYNIVKRHNGYIDIKSTPGVGSTFDVYLPATDRAPTDTATKTIEFYDKLNILVMDDEELILDSCKILLETLGHTVYLCRNGNEVIEMYKELKSKGINIDVFILDITIVGGMGGQETVKELLKMDSNIRAIVSSGYAEDHVFKDFNSYGFSAVLKKPYELQDVKEALRKAIAKN
ncbi:MAG: ATP-binding protein [Calditerrivibrio sp.]|nr:ATP-binding protein [Calditerrivibrio sp.]